jgi:hypothetical protein
MFAGHMPAPGRVELIDVPEPVLPREPRPDGVGDIIFQPEIACLCGSDVPFFERNDPSLVPETGHSLHEMIGRVVDTNGSRYRAGDRVLAVPVYQLGLFERYVVSEERAIPLDTRVLPEHAMMAQPLGTVILKVCVNFVPCNLSVSSSFKGSGY